jgi:hypothetical protein
MPLLCSTQSGIGAENLESPEIGAASVPDLIADAIGGGLFVTESRADLANEISEAIKRLQVARPNISWSDTQNVLVAAHCLALARKAGRFLAVVPLTVGSPSHLQREAPFEIEIPKPHSRKQLTI